MNIIADYLLGWLTERLAEAGWERLRDGLLGGPQQQALRDAATDAIVSTAEEIFPGNDVQAGELAAAMNQAFMLRRLKDPSDAGGTITSVWRAGIAAQLAEVSSDYPNKALAARVSAQLERAIMVRGSKGGPLQPLADQLNHEKTQALIREQGEAQEQLVRRLAGQGDVDQVGSALASLGSASEQDRLASIRTLELIVQEAKREGDSSLHLLVLSALADFVREHSDEPWPEGRRPPYRAPTPAASWPSYARRARQHPPLPDIVAAVNVIGRYPVSGDAAGQIDLTGANLALALLNGMDFSGVNFYQANLTGVEFKGASLVGARLVLAILPFASLDDADLRGANLNGAEVSDSLQDAKVDETTELPSGWLRRGGRADPMAR